jgi:chromosome segregation ATPase
MASNTQVKKLLDNIGLTPSESPAIDSKLNSAIQNKFDTVFKDGEEGEEEELSFSANKESTQNNIKIVTNDDSADFKLVDDAPLSLGENSSPALSAPESTNGNISFDVGDKSLNLATSNDEIQNSIAEDDLSFGEISEESDAPEVKETSAPAMPLPTRTRLQAVEEVAEVEEEMIQEVDEAPAEHVMSLNATEDETGEIAVPDFETQEVVAPSTVKLTQESVKQEKVLYNFDQNEVARLQSMVREMRADREDLLKQIHNSQKDLKIQVQSNLTYRSEVEDGKVELNILKKRHSEEVEELKHQVRMSEHKKLEYEEKVKNYQKEFDRLGQKVQFEVSHVKKREKELETKLELLVMDSQAQIQSRDNKTLELKRKIDALEFNMENLSIQEAKAREDKIILEDKLNKIMKNLRGSIKVIESDISHELSTLNKNDPDKNNS